MSIADRKVNSTWAGRSLAGYIGMHKETARQSDCLGAFLNAKTLTEARKILFGMKKKNTKGRNK